MGRRLTYANTNIFRAEHIRQGVYLSNDPNAKVIRSREAIRCTRRPDTPATAESHERTRGLCLLLRRDTEARPAEDLPAPRLPSPCRDCGGEARGQVDALPHRATGRHESSLDSRCNPQVIRNRPEHASRPRAAGPSLLPASRIRNTPGCANTDGLETQHGT